MAAVASGRAKPGLVGERLDATGALAFGGAEAELPALYLFLRAGDERRDLALAGLHPLLPLGERALALVQALDPELVVDEAQGVPLVELALPAVELARPVRKLLLGRFGAL